MKRIVGYVRVSTEKQAEEGISIDDQIYRIKAYCAAQPDRYTLVCDPIVDDGYTSANLERPGVKTVLKMLETGECDAILVTSLDRLTRSLDDILSMMKNQLKDGGLISMAEDLNFTTAMGRMFVHILTVMLQWQRENIGEKTKHGMQHLKRTGVRLGSPTFGEKRLEQVDENDRRISVPDPEELVTLARITELRALGASLRDIAKTLTQEGRRTKRGRQWGAETVRLILQRTQTQEAA